MDFHLEIVLKIAERCNINCSYCYMFNKGSDFSDSKPKLISNSVASDVAAFVREGAIASSAGGVRVIFHGGEPLMIGKRRLEGLCELFEQHLKDVTALSFSLQTNGILVDQEWVDLFSKWDMQIGVSLDGPAWINDRERVDHKGRGTYSRVVNGLNNVKRGATDGSAISTGILCVIDNGVSGQEVFKHFAEELGLDSLDFLIPMETWDSIDASGVGAVGDYLIGAFDAWIAHGDPAVNVRIFKDFIRWLTDRSAFLRIKNEARRNYLIITMGSDGTFGPDDSLRTCLGDDLFEFNVRDHSLSDYLGHPGIRALLKAQSEPPAECLECSWKLYCRGGSANGRVINRFSKEAGFDRKSVMCSALRRLYSHIARWLIDNGMPRDAIIARLEGRPAKNRPLTGAVSAQV